MQVKTRIRRRSWLVPWIASGAVAIVLGLSAPSGIAGASDTWATDPLAPHAVVIATPTKKVGSANPKPNQPGGGVNSPQSEQPANPCIGAVSRPNCPQKEPTATPTPKPKDPTPTYTPTPKPRQPTNTPTPVPEPTDTPTPKPRPTKTPTLEPTATPVPPTNTPIPPTNTPVPPTETPVPPTATPIPPTATPIPPTETPVVVIEVPPTATFTPVPPPPTATATFVPLTPTDVPVIEAVVDPSLANEPAEEPTPEPSPTPEPTETPDPTATPLPPTETPLPPTPIVTSTPIVAAIVAEPTATHTPAAPAPEPTVPSGEVEIAASSPLSDPSPFVLLGTLLFALAAAAGQVLRGDPRMIRRITEGFDGVRRSVTHSAGDGKPGPDPSSAPSHDTQPRWATQYDTVSGGGQTVGADASFANGSTGLSRSPSVASTGGGAGGGVGGSGASGGLGGHAGGGDGFAKAASNGMDNLAQAASQSDGFAKAAGNGMDSFAKVGTQAPGLGGGQSSFGYDVAADALGHSAQVPPDGFGQNGLSPTDWSSGGTGGPSPSDAIPQAPAGGSLGGSHGSLGGGSAGDLARLPNSGGSGLANGSLGGGHGVGQGGDLLARGAAPSPDLASLPQTPAQPDIAFQGATGSESALAESLDRLARALPHADGAGPASFGTVTAPEGAAPSAGAFGPSWLGAGALARAPQTPLPPKTFFCPSCTRTLGYGHRYCGYCGEPLDKTLA